LQACDSPALWASLLALELQPGGAGGTALPVRWREGRCYVRTARGPSPSRRGPTTTLWAQKNQLRWRGAALGRGNSSAPPGGQRLPQSSGVRSPPPQRFNSSQLRPPEGSTTAPASILRCPALPPDRMLADLP
jgi:hypothetical protein